MLLLSLGGMLLGAAAMAAQASAEVAGVVGMPHASTMTAAATGGVHWTAEDAPA